MALKTKKFCRFNREMDIQLIEFVSKNEMLYNTSHMLYKDLLVRDDVWLGISTVLGRSVVECKTRWRSLRDLFHRRRKEERQGKPIRSQWEYMEMLSFLDKYTTQRKSDAMKEKDEDNASKSNEEVSLNNYLDTMPCTISNIFKRLEDEKTTAIETKGIKREPVDEEVAAENDSLFIETKRIKYEPTEEEATAENDSVFIETNTIKREPNEENENETIQLMREIRDATQQTQHPIKIFFDSMAQTVMSFPRALAAEAKLKVCQIVTELECRMLEEAGSIQGEHDPSI